jgi:septal ring factor EnvC (AmiA/AmiB activator)
MPRVATGRVAESVAAVPVPAGVYRRNTALLIPVAAVFVLGVFSAYQVGVYKATRAATTQRASNDVETSMRRQLAGALKVRTALDEQLASSAKSIERLSHRVAREEKDLAHLKRLNASLEERTQALSLAYQSQSNLLGSVSLQRDSLQGELTKTQASLQTVRQELNTLQDVRQKDLQRTANLETEINGLSAQLRDRAKTIDQQEQFLASDRDIRELMGARQLYIADVLDVAQNGRTQKPYGRIFYTQGKSLIFYAFDLDAQPGFGEAKSFQAWGRPDSDQAKPVSLGIFYMDNETNRRWVLKSDNPSLLAQIDAVFVTVEARGGSKKPSGKPFLYAYLRKAPVNHP